MREPPCRRRKTSPDRNTSPHTAVTPEITLITNKIEGHALIFIFQDAHIPVLSQIIHIKMVHILHFMRNDSLMHRYFGIMTRTSKYCLSKHFGRDPTTSAKPPVLINGTASDAINRIFFIATTSQPCPLAIWHPIKIIIQ